MYALKPCPSGNEGTLPDLPTISSPSTLPPLRSFPRPNTFSSPHSCPNRDEDTLANPVSISDTLTVTFSLSRTHSPYARTEMRARVPIPKRILKLLLLLIHSLAQCLNQDEGTISLAISGSNTISAPTTKPTSHLLIQQTSAEKVCRKVYIHV